MVKILRAIIIVYVLVFCSYATHKYLKQRDSEIGAEIDYKTAILQMKIWELKHEYSSSETAPSGLGI